MNMIKSLTFSKIVFFILLATICIFFCENAHAADMNPIDETLNKVSEAFQNGVGGFGQKIIQLSKGLFVAFGIITLIWNVSLLALKNGDISNISFEVIKFMIVMSIFWFLLSGVDTLFSDLATDLGNEARKISGFKSSGGVSIINEALDICKQIINPDEKDNPGWFKRFANFITSDKGVVQMAVEWFLRILLCLFVLVVCATITMNLLLGYLDFIFTLYGGIIILGLASSDLFKSDSIAYIKGIIGKAVLFYGQILCAMFCFAGIAELIKGFSTSDDFLSAILALMAVGMGVIMAAKVISTVPKTIAGFISPNAAAYTPMVDPGQAGMAAVKLGTMATGAGAIATAAGGGGLSSMATKGAFNKFAGTGVGQSVIGNAKIASGLVANSAAGKVALGTGRIAGGAVSAFAKQMSSMLNDIKKQ